MTSMATASNADEGVAGGGLQQVGNDELVHPIDTYFQWAVEAVAAFISVKGNSPAWAFCFVSGLETDRKIC